MSLFIALPPLPDQGLSPVLGRDGLALLPLFSRTVSVVGGLAFQTPCFLPQPDFSVGFVCCPSTVLALFPRQWDPPPSRHFSSVLRTRSESPLLLKCFQPFTLFFQHGFSRLTDKRMTIEGRSFLSRSVVASRRSCDHLLPFGFRKLFRLEGMLLSNVSFGRPYFSPFGGRL